MKFEQIKLTTLLTLILSLSKMPIDFSVITSTSHNYTFVLFCSIYITIFGVWSVFPFTTTTSTQQKSFVTWPNNYRIFPLDFSRWESCYHCSLFRSFHDDLYIAKQCPYLEFTSSPFKFLI